MRHPQKDVWYTMLCGIGVPRRPYGCWVIESIGTAQIFSLRSDGSAIIMDGPRTSPSNYVYGHTFEADDNAPRGMVCNSGKAVDPHSVRKRRGLSLPENGEHPVVEHWTLTQICWRCCVR